MKEKYNIILLALSLVSLYIFFSNSLIAALLVTVLIIIGMDLSTDLIYETTDSLLRFKPGMFIGITLFAFITSLDEIFVSGSSIVQGYNDISIGTMMGSVSISIAIFALLTLILRKRQRSLSSSSMFVIPAFLLILMVAEYFSLPLDLKIALTIITVIVSLALIFYIGFASDRGVETTSKADKKSGKFLIAISVFILMGLSFAMARVTDIFSVNLNVGGLASGFILPGIIGTLPEFFAIKSSLSHSDRQSASGILIGSTLIKGGIIFPILAMAFAYNPLESVEVTLATIVPTIIATIFLVAY